MKSKPFRVLFVKGRARSHLMNTLMRWLLGRPWMAALTADHFGRPLERGFGGVRWGPRQNLARLINAKDGIYEIACSVQCALKSGFGLSVLALILIMGRAWAEPPKEAPSEIRTVSAKAPQAGDKLASFVKLSLLSAGAKPRRALVYKLHRGQKEEFTVTMNVMISTSAAGQTGKWVKGPFTKLEGRLMVEELASDGTATVSYEYDVSAGPAEPAELSDGRANSAVVKGLKGRYLLSAQGNLKDVILSLPSELDPTLARMMRAAVESLRNFFVIFPIEPVGIGGSWELIWPELQILDLKSTLRYRYAIESIEADSVVMAVKGDQHVHEQEIENPPGLPPGSKIKLVSSGSLLQGQFIHDLAHLTPQAHVSGQGQTVTLMTIKEEGGSREREITTAMKMEMDIRRK